jgi:hypothetical protein
MGCSVYFIIKLSFFLHYMTMKMTAPWNYETSVATRQTAQRDLQEVILSEWQEISLDNTSGC